MTKGSDVFVLLECTASIFRLFFYKRHTAHLLVKIFGKPNGEGISYLAMVHPVAEGFAFFANLLLILNYVIFIMMTWVGF